MSDKLPYGTLADRVFESKHLTGPPWLRNRNGGWVQKNLRWLKKSLKEAVVFEITNVADYFYRGTPQEEWEIERDFPCLAPPYPTMWFEYNNPTTMNSEGRIISAESNRGLRTGVLMSAGSNNWAKGMTDEEVRAEAETHVEHYRKKIEQNSLVYGDRLQETLSKINPQAMKDAILKGPAAMRELGLTGPLLELFTDGLKLQAAEVTATRDGAAAVRRTLDECEKRGDRPTWTIYAMSYVWRVDFGLVGPFFQWRFSVGERGELWQGDSSFDIFTDPGGKLSDYAIDALGGGNTMVFPSLMALTFMACKNVTVREGELAEVKQRVVAGQRIPQVKYKVLEIQPMIKVMRDAAVGITGKKSPLHVCRGHFKDYRERGLFGKVKGIYWWDHHVRGNADEGVVFKDYSVN